MGFILKVGRWFSIGDQYDLLIGLSFFTVRTNFGNGEMKLCPRIRSRPWGELAIYEEQGRAEIIDDRRKH